MKFNKWLLLIAVIAPTSYAIYVFGIVYLNERAAEDGSAVAQCNVGMFFEKGRGHFKNEEKAIYWYIKSANQGYSPCQYNLARMLAKRADYTASFSWFMKAAMQNHPWSQYAVGKMYNDGSGVARNMKAAANWMRRAANQGLPPAQFYLATMYAKGEGVPYDLDQAAAWAGKAAAQGNKNADGLLTLIGEYRK